MTIFNATEWTLLLSAISASIVSILYTISKSRCKTVDCGCIHCDREVLPPEEDPRQSIPTVPLGSIETALAPRHSSPSVREHVRKLEHR